MYGKVTVGELRRALTSVSDDVVVIVRNGYEQFEVDFVREEAPTAISNREFVIACGKEILY